MRDLRVLLLIPARAGSQRLPRKNLCPLHGLPLVSWTAKCAVEARNMLTDCDVSVVGSVGGEIHEAVELENELKRCGVGRVLVRPDALAAGREADGWPAGLVAPGHALQVLAREGRTFDCLVLLQPTSPFRKPSHIVDAVQRFEASRALGDCSVISCCTPGVPNGAIYAAHPQRILQGKSWGFATASWLVMSRAESIDIDCQHDLDNAERLLGGTDYARTP